MLSTLHIHNLRNITEARVDFCQHFNVLHGANGSGKTSVLESIYLLSTGKSFRSNQVSKIIQENKQNFTLFGKILLENQQNTTLGFSRSITTNEVKFNGESVKKRSEVTKQLPVLVITQDSHKLIEGGPSTRREFLDWELFHVKQDFLQVWQNYRKLLKNRNMALASNASQSEIEAWNVGLAQFGLLYTNYRMDYIDELIPIFEKYLRKLLGEVDVTIRYIFGWNKEIELIDCLNKQYEKDKYSHRTEYGPHRADFRVLLDGKDAKDTVSRGQQKLIVYALNLAQSEIFKNQTGKQALLLFDDLSSELDSNHLKRLLNLLDTEFSQVFITTANLESIPLEILKTFSVFHVEHGAVNLSEESVENYVE